LRSKIAHIPQATGNRQQATGNRQQATGNRQQATDYNHSLTDRVNYLTAYISPHFRYFISILTLIYGKTPSVYQLRSGFYMVPGTSLILLTEN
jgi:hypothetical protein